MQVCRALRRVVYLVDWHFEVWRLRKRKEDVQYMAESEGKKTWRAYR